ncbi:hypothetical protein ABH999_000597 [Bradyrhizobium yuanmingense]|uniref:hypothetical protein n=1 Tax=Bradyrhizobium yuanmingense TaxID=108015 RepID=UPI003519A124
MDYTFQFDRQQYGSLDSGLTATDQQNIVVPLVRIVLLTWLFDFLPLFDTGNVSYPLDYIIEMEQWRE